MTAFPIAQPLSIGKRKQIVDQALVLFDQNYAHLPLKKAMHAVDPVQRLRLLHRRLEEASPKHLSDVMDFHREMAEIFASVRDLHMNYVLPKPLKGNNAILPFIVEEYFEIQKGKRIRKYTVSHTRPRFRRGEFRKGVEVISWNGVPIERAVMANAERSAGGNPDARHARGLFRLTARSLNLNPPPDEEWVVVGYRSGGRVHEVRIKWELSHGQPVDKARRKAELTAMEGIDLELASMHQARKKLIRPKHWKPGKERGALKGLERKFRSLLQAHRRPTSHGTFGYVRIRSFEKLPDILHIDSFVDEFVRLLRLLPGEGLILDVRENPGGAISAGECLLQLLTPNRIEPEPMQFINTPLNLRLCRRQERFARWVPSMEQAIQTGAVYSAGIPVSPPGFCNDRGQQYFGPVVLITDALCYSTADIFVAGFEDHKIGKILGTDGNTGAGGATVWRLDQLKEDFSNGKRDPNSPYKSLPGGTDMRVALLRSLRVGANAGAPLEDLGVQVPEKNRYFMTRNDVLGKNRDLIDAAASLLKKMPVYRLEVNLKTSGKNVNVRVTTQGISRLDRYFDDRSLNYLRMQDGRPQSFSVTPEANGSLVRLQGFKGKKLVASRLLKVAIEKKK